jgi:ABC-2 type transport system permease protein
MKGETPRGAPIGAARAARLVVGLQFRRTLNIFSSSLDMYRKKDASAKRTATPGKARSGFVIASLILLSMGFGAISMAIQAAVNITAAMGDVWSPSGGLPGVILVMFLSFCAVILMTSAGQDLTRSDWDLEWQVTFPVQLSTLLAVRILSRTVLNTMGLLIFWPFLSIIAWNASGSGLASPDVGWRLSGALGLGLAASLPLTLLAATVQTLADAGLRLSLSPPKLRNFQALATIVSVVLLYLCLSVSMSAHGSMVLGWAPAQPEWTYWLPWGLAARAAAAQTPGGVILTLIVLAAEAGVCAVLAVIGLQRVLRKGVVAAGGRETGRREKARSPAKAAPGESLSARRLLSPIQARELLLLSRDRTFLVQTLVMPVIIVVSQVVLNSAAADVFSAPAEHPEHLAAIAFGISAYGLMLSAFQTLNAEGQALWILYTVPHSVDSILRQKAVLWGVASLVYPVAIFGYLFAVSGGAISLTLVELALVVILGAPVFAVIATALGVFACDPLAQNVQKRLRPSFVYLYMLISSTYVYAIYVSTIWQRAALMTLTALLAVALWQKARDQTPYLLDPAASPPARVSVSDGLAAAMLFFVLQGLTSTILLKAYHTDVVNGRMLLIAFTAAGAATYGLMRFNFWRLKSEGAPKVFGDKGFVKAIAGKDAGRAVLWGALGGLAAAAGAFVYLKIAMHTPLMEQTSKIVLTGGENAALFAVLAVCAAPVFEEFIFRGLIFGGLRRSLGLAPSVLASAAIFGLVHPPASVIPVFALGVVAALVYERTRLLLGAMTAHAAYNAVVALVIPLAL